jgi:hypothetical protein
MYVINVDLFWIAKNNGKYVIMEIRDEEGNLSKDCQG